MSAGRDEGPIYYREIQKNAYLKRIPNENTGSKLLPLSHKKPPLKPMWTLFCVHNGRTPFLEQYPEAESACTQAHRPVWRACLRSARHVTASVRPRGGAEYDFLVDTDHGPVRMLAPDWESMQDWVTTLRNKLHELKIMGKGENVYCAAPSLPPPPPAPRAAARDPASPLPPVPRAPPDRVPGIEIAPPTRIQPENTPQSEVSPTQSEANQIPPELNPIPPEVNPTTPNADPIQPEVNQSQPEVAPERENIDISSWEPAEYPSTSQENKIDPKQSVTKICGQNICLDDSILKRNLESTDSDEEFFAEIDRLHGSIENLGLDDSFVDYRQRLVVNDKEGSSSASENQSDRPTNITVIQVLNKAPHTAIPLMGPETNVFQFDFKQNVPVTDCQTDFVNIVNTEANLNDNGYGTVFDKESDYGHLSLTTTVNLNCQGQKDGNGIYERLCMASTSNENGSPLPLRKLKAFDKVRKSSLPNLDVSDSTYEYLFPNNNKNATVTLTTDHHSLVEVNSNVAVTYNDTRPINSVVTNTSVTNRQINGVRLNSEVTGTSNSDNTRLSDRVNLTSSVSIGNVDLNTTVLRANIERSHSQNAYDRSPNRNVIRREENRSPKRDGKSEKQEHTQPKPIWKRGLTELSLLSRLRARVPGTSKRNENQTQQDIDRSVTSPAKVVHRSRGEARVDSGRRRSSSLSNGPPLPTPLTPLRARQAAALISEQRRGAAIPAALPARDAPLFVDYNRMVWIAQWGVGAPRCGGRAGDRVAALRGTAPRDAAHARQLVKSATRHLVDILFHRVPLAKIYVINKRDLESIGMKLDNECNITSVENGSPAQRAGLPPAGKWAVTEVNNRPINLIKGGEEEMNRLCVHGTEVSILIQPSALVKKLRQAARSTRPLLSLR